MCFVIGFTVFVFAYYGYKAVRLITDPSTIRSEYKRGF